MSNSFINGRRLRRTKSSPEGAEIVVEGRRCANFSSNDYLGLATHYQIKRACVDAALAFGIGSGGSPLMGGFSSSHAALEQELADLLGREKALVFSSGFMTNLGVITALARPSAAIVFDTRNHASLNAAAVLSRATLRRYVHANPNDLDAVLAATHVDQIIVTTDAVFSMDGTIAPLQDLASVSIHHKALLVVDDAHGFGVLGASGAGTLNALGLAASDVPIVVGTFGKALGTFGAFAAGESTYIDELMQRSRPYIYSTALPPPIVEATRTALKVMQSEEWRRDRLFKTVAYFRHEAQLLGLPLGDSPTPIQPIILGCEEKVLQAAQQLYQQNLYVVPVRSPTVPRNEARLRISLTANHSLQQIDRLLTALIGVCR